MKIKSNVITMALVVVSLMLGGIAAQAQGIFSPNSNDDNNADKIVAADSETSRAGGLFRDGGGNWWDEIDDGETGDPLEDPEPTPIGEGILILSLLSGGYALVKRKSKKKA